MPPKSRSKSPSPKYHLPKGLLSPEESPHYHLPTVESRHPSLIEDGVHRDDALEFAGQRVEMISAEHTGGAGSLEGVRGDGVPSPEDDVVEGSEVDDLAYRSGRPDPGVDTAHLSERADRSAKSVAGGEHTSDERGADRSESRKEDAEGGGRGAGGHRRNINTYCASALLSSAFLNYSSRRDLPPPRPRHPSTRVPARCQPERHLGRGGDLARRHTLGALPGSRRARTARRCADLRPRGSTPTDPLVSRTGARPRSAGRGAHRRPRRLGRPDAGLIPRRHPARTHRRGRGGALRHGVPRRPPRGPAQHHRRAVG